MINLILIVGALFGGWSFLLLVGGEQSRRVKRIKDQLAVDAEARARLQAEAEKPIVVS